MTIKALLFRPPRFSPPDHQARFALPPPHPGQGSTEGEARRPRESLLRRKDTGRIKVAGKEAGMPICAKVTGFTHHPSPLPPSVRSPGQGAGADLQMDFHPPPLRVARAEQNRARMWRASGSSSTRGGGAEPPFDQTLRSWAPAAAQPKRPAPLGDRKLPCPARPGWFPALPYAPPPPPAGLALQAESAARRRPSAETAARFRPGRPAEPESAARRPSANERPGPRSGGKKRGAAGGAPAAAPERRPVCLCLSRTSRKPSIAGAPLKRPSGLRLPSLPPAFLEQGRLRKPPSRVTGRPAAARNLRIRRLNGALPAWPTRSDRELTPAEAELARCAGLGSGLACVGCRGNTVVH